MRGYEIAPPHLGRVPRGVWALGGDAEQGIAGLGLPIGRQSGRQGSLANPGALRQEARALAGVNLERGEHLG